MKKIMLAMLVASVAFQQCSADDLDIIFSDEQPGLTMEVAAQPVESKIAFTDMPALVAGYVYYTHLKPGFTKLASVFVTQNADVQVEA